MTQSPLDFTTDIAISRAASNADATWKETAMAAIKRVAMRLPRFTADDIWDEIGDAAATHDGRALGGIMRAAVRDRLCEPTGEFVACRRMSRHKAPIQVWRSLCAVVA